MQQGLKCSSITGGGAARAVTNSHKRRTWQRGIHGRQIGVPPLLGSLVSHPLSFTPTSSLNANSQLAYSLESWTQILQYSHYTP